MGTCPENILDELESYVVSCDNTVTYKWISQKWNVHVNTAKQLLYSFLDKEKSKENPLNFEVIYFLSGPLKIVDEGKSYQVCLVREKDVEKVKSKLQKVVSEHVYSVQKSTVKDLHSLYIVDKANGDEILQGKSGKSSIKCEDAIPRAADLLVQAASRTASDSVKGKQSSDKNSHKSSSYSNKGGAEHQRNDKENGEGPLPAGNEKKDAPKGIAGMFAAQSGKTSNKKAETSAENENSKSSVIKKPLGKKANGIASLFAKQAERPPTPKPKKEEPKKEAEKIIIIEDEDPFASEDEEVVRKGLLSNDEDRSQSPIEPKAKPAKTKATNEKKKKKPKYLDGEEESPLVTKKRRRIKMMSSSEESDEEEMEVGESESPIPPKQKKPAKEALSDNDDDIIPATPQEAQCGPIGKKRMRKRVCINKTFADDQGFIVTKKEYVFESCTDDSDQSGDEATSSKEKVTSNGELNHEKEVSKGKGDGGNKKITDSGKDKNDLNSPGDENKESKGNKGKDTAKGKKPAGKKISPPTGRQGVLTSFFKRT